MRSVVLSSWLLGSALLFAACKREAPAPAATAGPACAPSAALAACGPEAPSPATATSPSRIDPEMAEICKKACQHEQFAEDEVVPAPRAKLGDLTRCPVSGVVFQVGAETPRVEHGGQGYWLCCDGCAERFQRDPARFSGS